MPVINGKTLLEKAPIKDMLADKIKLHGVSHGLGEAGYDIRIKQAIRFKPSNMGPVIYVGNDVFDGRFVKASTMEYFHMPKNLVGVVHDKSTWAREGLSVFNTVIEPNWRGNLTLEMVFHGNKEIVIPAGSGIAQVLFSTLVHDAAYEGKYQDQEDMPVPARFERV